MSDPQPHILMVDDEASVRELYGIYFDIQGFRVTAVANALEALKEVYSRKFDVIILDLGLAESNGIDLVEPIKAIQPTTPILIFTGRVVDQHFKDDALKKGVFSFLMKSHPLDYLVGETRRAINCARAESDASLA